MASTFHRLLLIALLACTATSSTVLAKEEEKQESKSCGRAAGKSISRKNGSFLHYSWGQLPHSWQPLSFIFGKTLSPGNMEFLP